ncbi:MAG: hypothetical protein AAF791_01665 [Bacteroidota bacterium]
MAHFHRLDAEADRDFLARGEADPFTGVTFLPTNVVVLTADGTVLLRETWEALGERYEGSGETMPWGTPTGDGAQEEEPTVAAPPPPVPAPTTLAAPPPAAPPASVAPAPAPPAPAPRRTASAPPPEEPTRRRPWLAAFLWILAIAALVIVALLVFRAFTAEPPSEPVVERVDELQAPEVIEVQAGDIDGTLADGDATVNGRFEDRYAFTADSSGRVLSFVLVSEDFRPDLVVRGPDGQQYEARPSGDAGTRVVIDDLRGPGRFEILVTSREPAGDGAYTLSIGQETPIVALRADDRTVRAVLGEQSVLVDGFFRDTYEFGVEAEREYTLTLASTAFEVVPTLTSANGARVRTEREGDALTFTPSADARYRLVVSSRERAKRGPYTVRLAAGPAPEPEAPEPPRILEPNAAPARDSLATGQQRVYTFSGQVGDQVRVDARALGFSPNLVLVGPDGRRVVSDSDEERANVQQTLATAGTYRVIVTGGEGSGLFQLSLEATVAPRADDIPRMPGLDEPPAPEGDDGGTPYEPQLIDR